MQEETVPNSEQTMNLGPGGRTRISKNNMYQREQPFWPLLGGSSQRSSQSANKVFIFPDTDWGFEGIVKSRNLLKPF